MRTQRRGIGVDEFQLAGDAVQPRLDGGIGDAEHLFHLLDRTMALEKGGNKDLIFHGQPGQLGQFESPLDGDAALIRTRSTTRRRPG